MFRHGVVLVPVVRRAILLFYKFSQAEVTYFTDFPLTRQ
jgi:hypothetical protein